MTFSAIAPEILVKSYYDSFREDPEMGVKRIMFLMIYDDREAKWVQKFLQKVGVLEESSSEKEQKAQLRKIHRVRSQVSDLCGLPRRGKRGATNEYRTALVAWRAINPRPTEEQILAGWMPQPLGATTGIPQETQQSVQVVRSETATSSPTKPTPIPPELGEPIAADSFDARKKGKSVELPPDYKPEDFQPKPPPPLAIPICGLPVTGAD